MANPIKKFLSSSSGDGTLAMKAGLGYTIGNILIKGIAFLSLPVFSRLMTTSEFGIYNVFVSYEAILYVIVGLAMHGSLQSANLEFRGRIDEYVSSITLIYIINACIISIIVFLFVNQISNILNYSRPLLQLLILYSLGTAIMQLYNSKASLKYEYKKYLYISFSYSIGNVLLSIVLMLTILANRRDLARILGTTVTVFVIMVGILISFYRTSKPKIDKQYFKFGVKYSLPLVPHGVSQVLLAQFDRIMIRTMVSDSAAGIYSLAANVKLILTVITDSIVTAWRTWFFRAMSDNKIDEIKLRSRQVIELYLLFAIGLMSISHEIILLFGGTQYDAAKYVAIPMIADAFLLFLYGIIVQSEYYAKKTQYIMLGTIIATILNIVTNYIFIKKFGFIAAAYTTLFSYIVYVVLHIFISYRAVGFMVVPLKYIMLFAIVLAIDGALNLLFIDTVVLRLLIGFVFLMIFGVHLWKSLRLAK